MIQDIRDGTDHHGEKPQVWTTSRGQWFDLFCEPRSFVEFEKINFKCHYENNRKYVCSSTMQFQANHIITMRKRLFKNMSPQKTIHAIHESSFSNTSKTMSENMSAWIQYNFMLNEIWKIRSAGNFLLLHVTESKTSLFVSLQTENILKFDPCNEIKLP